MLMQARTRVVLAFAAAALFAIGDAQMRADQPAPGAPVNDLPNPYETITGFFNLPAGSGDRRAPSKSTRTAARSGSPSAAARTAAWIRQPTKSRTSRPFSISM